MAHPPFPVLLEDNHLLAVVKPAGLPTMGVDPSRPSLFSLARQYLKEKYQKPGNVYLGVVSRLDACVTGVVVLARTSKAARRLSKQFRDREVGKLYWALVPQPPDPLAADLVDWLRKDEPAAQNAGLWCACSRCSRGPALVPHAARTGRGSAARNRFADRSQAPDSCPVGRARAAYPGRSPIWQSLAPFRPESRCTRGN